MTDPEFETTRTQQVTVWRHPDGLPADDLVAVEAPLEVRLDGQPFSVIMRTPGADTALALGFLLTEGLLHARDDVADIEELPDAQAVNVTFAPGRAEAVADALQRRRRVTTTSSCGLCGRSSLASLDLQLPRCRGDWTVAPATLLSLPHTLQRVQTAFARTGGLHAAALFDPQGVLECSAEDVGRHNAVDKLLGMSWKAGRLPLSDRLLMVSGRSSYEIVQKAWMGGLPLVAAVSAPSSLAVELADAAGMTLLGFVRGERFNVYTHRHRVADR